MNTKKPDFGDADLKRAVDLMEAAGWIAKRDKDNLFFGLQMTPEGQTKASVFLKICRELDCRCDRDVRVVLGVIDWYLNRNEMN